MDTPPPFRQHITRRRRIVALFTERLALKGTAVLIAIVLWFVVNAKEPQLEVVPVRFTPVLDSSLALRDPLPELHALIAGSPKELIKLTADEPEIRRQITSDAPDTVVIDLRPDDVTLPEGVDAVVRDVQPRSLTLRFETTWTRKAAVRSAIQVANDMGTPLTTRFDPESVQV
ncbi:MAG TPA: hypothetical protein VN717_00425, partial [Gemmatimonadaceae bacterium]|nr:hypothetical protein [Gemmatimonadaceae bacterium]